MNTKSIVKQALIVFGASVVLAAGVAHAAPVDQLKRTDGSSEVVAANAIKSVPVAATTETVREPVDVNSPSFRKFLDDVAQRSGG
jgi:uncharacterized protein YcfJ